VNTTIASGHQAWPLRRDDQTVRLATTATRAPAEHDSGRLADQFLQLRVIALARDASRLMALTPRYQCQMTKCRSLACVTEVKGWSATGERRCAGRARRASDAAGASYCASRSVRSDRVIRFENGRRGSGHGPEHDAELRVEHGPA
jgi:hypothetical protein